MGDSEAEHGAGNIIDWTVLKSIQEANASSMSAMEEYLLLTVGPEALGDSERTREYIEQSIAHHEQIIEQLELAVGELDSRTRLSAD